MTRSFATALMALTALAASPASAESLFSPAELTANDLEGSKWRIVRVNGVHTPRDGVYMLEFRRGEARAKFGCNLITADYRIDNRAIVIGEQESREIYCSEPSAGFELDGIAILERPLIGRWISVRKRLDLFNEAGSLQLVRR